MIFRIPNSGWMIRETGNNQWGYLNNHYQITVGDPNLRVISVYLVNASGGTIRTSGIINQDQPQTSYGVVCRYKDIDNYFFFEISSDGTYQIGRRLNGEYRLLNGMQGVINSAINPTGYNEIFVTFFWEEMSLYVNDVLIETVYDNSLLEGYVGLSTTTGEYGGFEVSFEEFNLIP